MYYSLELDWQIKMGNLMLFIFRSKVDKPIQNLVALRGMIYCLSANLFVG